MLTHLLDSFRDGPVGDVLGHPLQANCAKTRRRPPNIPLNRMSRKHLCKSVRSSSLTDQGVLSTGGDVGGCQQHHFFGTPYPHVVELFALSGV
jgi:hypothetical protein